MKNWRKMQSHPAPISLTANRYFVVYLGVLFNKMGFLLK